MDRRKFRVRRVSGIDLPFLDRAILDLGRSEGKMLDRQDVRSGNLCVLNDPFCWAFIADDERGGPAGMAILTSEPSPFHGGRRGTLSDVFVRPDLRGQGVFRSLHEHILMFAAEAGMKTVRLIVHQEKPDPQAIYRHYGWEFLPYFVMEIRVGAHQTLSVAVGA